MEGALKVGVDVNDVAIKCRENVRRSRTVSEMNRERIKR